MYKVNLCKPSVWWPELYFTEYVFLQEPPVTYIDYLVDEFQRLYSETYCNVSFEAIHASFSLLMASDYTWQGWSSRCPPGRRGTPLSSNFSLRSPLLALLNISYTVWKSRMLPPNIPSLALSFGGKLTSQLSQLFVVPSLFSLINISLIKWWSINPILAFVSKFVFQMILINIFSPSFHTISLTRS